MSGMRETPGPTPQGQWFLRFALSIEMWRGIRCFCGFATGDARRLDNEAVDGRKA